MAMTFEKCRGCEYKVDISNHGQLKIMCSITGEELEITKCVKDGHQSQHPKCDVFGGCRNCQRDGDEDFCDKCIHGVVLQNHYLPKEVKNDDKP